jgi:hypothetical protein
MRGRGMGEGRCDFVAEPMRDFSRNLVDWRRLRGALGWNFIIRYVNVRQG